MRANLGDGLKNLESLDLSNVLTDVVDRRRLHSNVDARRSLFVADAVSAERDLLWTTALE